MGSRRRWALSASRWRVSSFSLARSSLRAASHSSRDTTGGRFMRLLPGGRGALSHVGRWAGGRLIAGPELVQTSSLPRRAVRLLHHLVDVTTARLDRLHVKATPGDAVVLDSQHDDTLHGERGPVGV